MSIRDPIDTGAAPQAKPCTTCRRRKVKCDKLQPCGNCSRANQVCIYDGLDRIDSMNLESAPQSNDNDTLRERLSRLEQMMATMMMSGQAAKSPEIPRVIGQVPNPSFDNTVSTASQLPNEAYTNRALAQPASELPTGHIVFKEGCSAYFDPDFWPVLISEVEDLRQLFDDGSADEIQWSSYSALGIPSVPGADSSVVHPSIEQSNILCKYFFECVNPFIRIVHEGLFARELNEYRRGTFTHPRVFEALLFAIYTLTISSLDADVIEKPFSCSKEALLSRMKSSAQVAFVKINFLESDKVYALMALLHYLSFLFQQNSYREAVALLGSASRLAQNMGIHRDPSHFPYSPWVREIRRRVWNHLCILDSISMTLYGTESCVPFNSDARPPKNANDGDWHASRFAKPSSVPRKLVGWKGITFALVNRRLADLTRELSKIHCQSIAQKDLLINQVESEVTELYLADLDMTKPPHTIIAALVQVRMASIRLPIHYRRSKGSSYERQKLFIAALDLLEAYQYHAAMYATLSWEWVFSSIIPWHALAIVLTEVSNAEEQLIAERAELQIETYFQRFSTVPVSRTPLWRMLVGLRENMHEAGTQIHVSPSNAIVPTSGVELAASMLADDLMFDFPGGGPSAAYGSSHDQLGFQDAQDFPWMDGQMDLSSITFQD